MQRRTIPPLPDKPASKRRGSKIVWLLLILFLVLLGVLFFRSPLSKVTEIHYSGHPFITVAELSDTTGLRVGMPFFGTSSAAISERIKAKYPFVQAVQVDKQFPGAIHVELQQFKVVAYELTGDGRVVACLENGTEVAINQQTMPVIEKPLLTQWSGKKELKGKLSVQLARISQGLLADISEIRSFPSDSYPDRIKMYTRSGFEVISSITLLPEKMTYLNGVIQTQEPGQITMLKADSYIPFTSLQQESEQNVEPEKNSTQ
ncbi:cell division protein FtsQ/DivIB [Paenibacillus sp. 481]|uniref:cell division protein FtsQ/DivIB n=1 Tax=Paenibacillus sp. 481 TaxID=2835869 RepID=UPI001E3D156B|nr:FtsQ-type POTRA domain-containing protein [Paenibacillus sp. 481]